MHQDWRNWNQVRPLGFGFLPIGLAYHAGYSLVAALLMTLLVKWAWPQELERMETSASAPGAEPPQA